MKGEMVKRILGIQVDCDFIFCAGDDKTDEDMFKSLGHIINPSPRTSRSASYSTSPQFPEARKSPTLPIENLNAKNVYTVAVSSSPRFTHASWRLDTSDDVVNLLSLISSE
eukprot:NODE_94_length_21525_cov_0.751003.p18 type:complete len:111 gc:universal NODE_94_length_21525_cov_0.751003:7409-7741(+)